MILFPYSGGIQPPILSGDPTLHILPAPPLFSDPLYLADVLDNRGVPRYEGRCLDLVYNQSSHTLDAANGARLFDLNPGSVPDLPAPHPLGDHPILPAYEAEMVRNMETALRAVQINQQLSPGQLQQMESIANNPQFPVIDVSPKILVTSAELQLQAVRSTIAQYRDLVLARDGPTGTEHLQQRFGGDRACISISAVSLCNESDSR